MSEVHVVGPGTGTVSGPGAGTVSGSGGTDTVSGNGGSGIVGTDADRSDTALFSGNLCVPFSGNLCKIFSWFYSIWRSLLPSC